MFDNIEAAAREQGWAVERTQRGHRRLIPPDKSRPIVIGAGTCSDGRVWRQFLTDARRSGWSGPGRLG
jgi:hypothetical protein